MAGKDYYGVLEVSENASLEEINRAYSDLLEVYGHDSQGTYSLYDDDQREEVLTEIEEAYKILSNEVERKDYDRNVYRLSDYKALKGKSSQREKVSEKTSSEKSEDLKGHASEILSGFDPVNANGVLLKRLRESVGLSLSDVHGHTRVNASILKLLEEDDYLKLPGRTYTLGFLKLYFRLFTDQYEIFAREYTKKYDSFSWKKEKQG